MGLGYFKKVIKKLIKVFLSKKEIRRAKSLLKRKK